MAHYYNSFQPDDPDEVAEYYTLQNAAPNSTFFKTNEMSYDPLAPDPASGDIFELQNVPMMVNEANNGGHFIKREYSVLETPAETTFDPDSSLVSALKLATPSVAVPSLKTVRKKPSGMNKKGIGATSASPAPRLPNSNKKSSKNELSPSATVTYSSCLLKVQKNPSGINKKGIGATSAGPSPHLPKSNKKSIKNELSPSATATCPTFVIESPNHQSASYNGGIFHSNTMHTCKYCLAFGTDSVQELFNHIRTVHEPTAARKPPKANVVSDTGQVDVEDCIQSTVILKDETGEFTNEPNIPIKTELKPDPEVITLSDDEAEELKVKPRQLQEMYKTEPVSNALPEPQGRVVHGYLSMPDVTGVDQYVPVQYITPDTIYQCAVCAAKMFSMEEMSLHMINAHGASACDSLTAFELS